jgi:tetratricopeptide (TPR) repeat protein
LNKAKKHLPKDLKRSSVKEGRTTPVPRTSPLNKSLGLIVAAVAFLLYANTLNYNYALDDYSLIIENTVTQKGVKAIPEIFSTGYRSGYNSIDVQLYRPLSKAMFAVEWQLAPNKPELGHLINVLLFSLTCFVLFYMLSICLKGSLIPFIAALLFAAHPLHTEIVANIKSRDEILTLLFVLLSAISVFKYVKGKSIGYLFLAVISYSISLFSKESAITFLAVIPLMIYFFTDTKLSKIITAIAPLIIVTLIFLFIRSKILTGGIAAVPMIDNYLYGIKDFISQKATAIFLMGVYLKLLFFPYHLMADASYSQFPFVTAGDWRFILSAIAYIALIVFAILRFKKKDIFSFSILYFLITASIISNVLFLIGTNYGERLMYAPSLGFCIAVAALIAKVLGQKEKVVADKLSSFLKTNIKTIGVTAAIVLVYSFKTIARNGVWYDNMSLYENGVLDAPNSARSHYYLGNQLAQDSFLETIKDSAQKQQYINQGVVELNKALELYPDYGDALSKLGKIYMDKKDYAKSEPYYVKALELNPTNSTYLNNYGNLLFNSNRFAEAKEKLELAVKYNPYYAHALSNLASVYGTYGENYALRAEQERKNNNAEAARQDEQAAVENFNNAVTYFRQAIKMDANFLQPYYMLGITYRKLGDEPNAQYYLGLFEKMKKK